MHRVEAFWPGYPERAETGPVHPVRIDGELLERKLAALGAHVSQVGPLHAELGADDYRRLASYEAYRPGNTTAAQRLTGAAALAA